MAQPAQVKFTLPNNDFAVIDNTAAPAFPSLNAGTFLGYDTSAAVDPGAVAQGLNSFSNGTVPDAASAPTISPSVPVIVQKHGASSTGSVASLANAFGSNNVAGNSIVVVCGVGNGTAPTISDTQTNSYSSVVQIANGTAFNVAIFVATNVKAGANTVTVNNGGTAASIASEVYEFSGFITASNTLVVDNIGSSQGSATTSSPAVSVVANQVNDFVLAAFGLGTAAQTITVAGTPSSYTNDSGQLNPTTPAGLFSFVSASLNLGSSTTTAPSASVGVAEPWAVAAATLKASTPASTIQAGLVVLNSPLSTRLYFKNPA